MRASPSMTRSYNESVTIPNRKGRTEDSVIEPLTAIAGWVHPIGTVAGKGPGEVAQHRATKNTGHPGIDLDFPKRFQTWLTEPIELFATEKTRIAPRVETWLACR